MDGKSNEKVTGPVYEAQPNQEPQNTYFCILERRTCRYAYKVGPVFECKALSDDAMTCRK